MLASLKNKTVVVKCGGAAMVESAQMAEMMQALVALHQAGVQVVIVHGGGPEISKYCQKLNMPVQFVQGQRVTDAATLEVAQMVLFGKTNRNIVAQLNQQGLSAVGLTGQDARCVLVQKFQTQEALGFVGEVVKVDTKLLQTLLQNGFLPVIAPIGTDKNGQAYNVNGDLMAGAIAGALKAEKLIILTDVNGFYQDINNPNSRVPQLQKKVVAALLVANQVEGGMAPKLQASVDALNQGVKAVHLLEGKKLREFFDKNQQDLGTVVI